MITPRHRWTLAALLAIVIAVATGTFAYLNWNRTVIVAGLFINYFRTFAAPVGTLITENAPTDETAVDAGATELSGTVKKQGTGQAIIKASPRSDTRGSLK